MRRWKPDERWKLTKEEKRLVENWRSVMRPIWWSVGDFHSIGELSASAEGKKADEMYDESKFMDALERMVMQHDCANGITWETVSSYLGDCLKEGEG